MRKYLSIILMAALVLCAMLMVACDDEQPVGHQHTLVDTVVEPRCDTSVGDYLLVQESYVAGSLVRRGDCSVVGLHRLYGNLLLALGC